MTDKELKKLSRTQLLELFLTQTKQLDETRQQLEEAQRQLASRQLTVEKAGSLAEAAMELNGVLAAAQQAADQYLLNIKSQHQILDEAQSQAREILDQAQCQADEMVARAQKDSQRYWDNVRRRLSQLTDRYPGLRQDLLRQANEKKL